MDPASMKMMNRKYYEPGPSTEYGGMYSSPYIKAPLRTRLNKLAIALAVFIPWAAFSLVFSLLSFSVHYHHPLICWLCVIAGFVLAIAAAMKAAIIWKKYHGEEFVDASHEPTWYLFLACTCFLAVAVGVIFGSVIYSDMVRYYDWTDLAKSTGVDPTASQGREFMDAGVVVWTNSTRVDTRHAIGFKDGTVYCVAPITVGNDPLATYDFWAAGTDCCNGYPQDFDCGLSAVSLRTARGGLRIMDDNLQSFYRVAVQQAEAEWGIKADHPLFFTWMEDPEGELNDLYQGSITGVSVGVVVYFVFQAILVMIAVWYYKREFA